MSLVNFDPQIRYANDWRFFDDVEDAKYHTAAGEHIDTAPRPTNQSVKVRPLTVSSREYQQFARAYAINPTDRLFVVWEAGASIEDAQDGDTLVVDDVTWRIVNASETNRSYLVVQTRRVIKNDDDAS